MSDGQPYPRGIGHPKSHYILQQLSITFYS